MVNPGRGGRRNQRRNRPTPSSPNSLQPQQSNPTSQLPGKTLPGDLIIEILCRTPVKPLVRFKCVSRAWYALINHPNFIKKHLHYNIANNTHVIFNAYNRRNFQVRNQNYKLISLLRVDDSPVKLLDIDTRAKDNFGYPKKINFTDFAKRMVLAGSINGVVLVTHTDELNGRFVVLWNPSINQWKPVKIPKLPSCSGSEGVTRTSVGLGYDEDADDYKIIRIETSSRAPDFFSGFRGSRVEIYSVKRDFWKDGKEVGVISFWPQLPHCNFIVRGVPYFVGLDEMPEDVMGFQHEILAWFDPCTGSYNKVQYPEFFRNKDTWVHPFEYRDSVAAIVHDTPKSPDPTVDLYLLNDNTTNWTKMFSIGPLPCNGFHFPKQGFKTGEIILEPQLDKRKSYLYDPKANCFRHLNGISNLDPLWYESYSHTESLVSIKGMELIGNEDRGKEDKHKKTKPRKMHGIDLLSTDFKSMLHL